MVYCAAQAVEFMPLKWRLEGSAGSMGIPRFTSNAELRGGGIGRFASLPRQSTLREQQERYEQRIRTLEGGNMLTDEQKAELRAIMAEAFQQRDADASAQDANSTAIATAVGAAFQQFRDDGLPALTW